MRASWSALVRGRREYAMKTMKRKASKTTVLALRTSDKDGRGRGGRLGHRLATGYVGEDGIEPNVAYKLDSNG